MVSILIVDDHELVRMGLCGILQSLDGQTVRITEAASAAAAEHYLDHTEQPVDLVLLDLNLPDSEGLGTLVRFRERYPEVNFSLLTGMVDCQIILRAYEIGISGFIPKASSPQIMQAAMKLILSGGVYIPREILSCFNSSEQTVPPAPAPDEEERVKPLPPPQPDSILDLPQGPVRFTSRQMEVVSLMIQGLSNKEIGRTLDMAYGTVKNHVATILRELDTNSRSKAVTMLIKLSATNKG